MVMGLILCSEGPVVSIYTRTPSNISDSDVDVTDALTQSMSWPVVNACSARADVSLSKTAH